MQIPEADDWGSDRQKKSEDDMSKEKLRVKNNKQKEKEESGGNVRGLGALQGTGLCECAALQLTAKNCFYFDSSHLVWLIQDLCFPWALCVYVIRYISPAFNSLNYLTSRS